MKFPKKLSRNLKKKKEFSGKRNNTEFSGKRNNTDFFLEIVLNEFMEE